MEIKKLKAVYIDDEPVNLMLVQAYGMEFGLNIKSSSMNDFNKQEYQEFFKKINVSPQIYYEIQKADKNALEVLKLNIEALNVYNGFIQKSNNGYVIKVKPNKKKAIDILYSHKYN